MAVSNLNPGGGGGSNFDVAPTLFQLATSASTVGTNILNLAGPRRILLCEISLSKGNSSTSAVHWRVQADGVTIFSESNNAFQQGGGTLNGEVLMSGTVWSKATFRLPSIYVASSFTITCMTDFSSSYGTYGFNILHHAV